MIDDLFFFVFGHVLAAAVPILAPLLAYKPGTSTSIILPVAATV